MWPNNSPRRNELLSPPPRFELLDAAGALVETALYEATVSIKSASNSNQQFGDGSKTTVVFDENNQAIFDQLFFDFPGTVELEFTLTNPANSGLPAYTGPTIEISGRADPCVNATCEEQVINRIFYEIKKVLLLKMKIFILTIKFFLN